MDIFKITIPLVGGLIFLLGKISDQSICIRIVVIEKNSGFRREFSVADTRYALLRSLSTFIVNKRSSLRHQFFQLILESVTY
jgi:hypothetical protein